MAVFQIALERKAIAGDQDHATHFLTEPRYMLSTAADVEGTAKTKNWVLEFARLETDRSHPLSTVHSGTLEFGRGSHAQRTYELENHMGES